MREQSIKKKHVKWHFVSRKCHCEFPLEQMSHLLKPQVFHHLLLPVRSSHHTLNPSHYVQFVRLVWIASILLMFF